MDQTGIHLVICAYGPNGSVEYPTFLASLGEMLESAPTGTSSFYWGTSTLTWAETVTPEV